MVRQKSDFVDGYDFERLPYARKVRIHKLWGPWEGDVVGYWSSGDPLVTDFMVCSFINDRQKLDTIGVILPEPEIVRVEILEEGSTLTSSKNEAISPEHMVIEDLYAAHEAELARPPAWIRELYGE